MKRNCTIFPLAVMAVVALGLIILTGCQKRQYVIGVSQCADDVWHKKLTSEFLMMGYANDSVRIEFKSSREDARLQTAQIDSLIAMGVDLLVVSPNNIDALTPSIEKAYDKGIPVVLYDRRINSDKYTAFIGSDNRSIGYELGKYIAGKMDGKGRVVEILGQRNSSSSVDRHAGFFAAMQENPGITVADTVYACNWEREGGEAAMERLLRRTGDFSYVFVHNDRMAYGVYLVLKRHGLTGKVKIVGVDGLSGKNGGLECVDNGIFDASYFNPTSGDDIMALAMNILKGQKYERVNKLSATIITKENAHLTLVAMKDANSQRSVVDRLNDRVDKYRRNSTFHETMMWIGIAFLLVLVVAFQYYRIYSAKYHSVVPQNEKQKQPTLSNDKQHPDEDENPANVKRNVNPLEDNYEGLGIVDKEFVKRLRTIIVENMGNSEFGVEAIGREMGLSRVQLYRKVKAATGLSVVDLLRKSRLLRGKALLQQTDKSIAEIAYEVGFSSPSYFTKCFKDEFAMLPCDVR